MLKKIRDFLFGKQPELIDLARDERPKYVVTVRFPEYVDAEGEKHVAEIEYYMIALPKEQQNPKEHFLVVYKKTYGKEFDAKILFVEPFHAILLI